MSWLNGREGEQVGTTAPSAIDRARDAAVKSFHHRYGRLPSDEELESALPLYLSEGEREALRRQGGGSDPILARGVAVPPRIARPVPPPVHADPAQDGEPQSGSTWSPHPYLDAYWKTLRALYGGALLLPPAALREVAPPPAEEGKARSPEELILIGRWLDSALRAQVEAYDTFKSDPDRSYQTYTKERVDLGPCLHSQKEDPRLPCYYAGMTGGEGGPRENVAERDKAHYPSPSYFGAQLDCSTRRWVSARAREQELIEHFRGRNVSDNRINSIVDNIWRPYMAELARRECGHIPLPQPERR